ncbi:MAG: UDP-N-acetylmuramoyl-L-alanine--D-glutamate ligase, partial [Candidatus Omnitrophota bacterium]
MMVKTRYFRKRKVAIIGLGRSGLACAELLYGLGADIKISDSLDNFSTRKNAGLLDSKKIKIELGRHTPDFIEGRELVIVSPGVQNSALPLIWARQSNIPVISEIELAWLICPATVIAVTGSNGKTTVTTLIARIIKEAGRKAFICGNIGRPFSAEVNNMKAGDFVSLEVSSFQL